MARYIIVPQRRQHSLSKSPTLTSLEELDSSSEVLVLYHIF